MNGSRRQQLLFDRGWQESPPAGLQDPDPEILAKRTPNRNVEVLRPYYCDTPPDRMMSVLIGRLCLFPDISGVPSDERVQYMVPSRSSNR